MHIRTRPRVLPLSLTFPLRQAPTHLQNAICRTLGVVPQLPDQLVCAALAPPDGGRVLQRVRGKFKLGKLGGGDLALPKAAPCSACCSPAPLQWCQVPPPTPQHSSPRPHKPTHTSLHTQASHHTSQHLVPRAQNVLQVPRAGGIGVVPHQLLDGGLVQGHGCRGGWVGGRAGVMSIRVGGWGLAGVCRAGRQGLEALFGSSSDCWLAGERTTPAGLATISKPRPPPCLSTYAPHSEAPCHPASLQTGQSKPSL